MHTYTFILKYTKYSTINTVWKPEHKHTAQTHTSNTLCHMKFGMEAQLDGCQHITVETQQLMEIHLHIYYFILASHKPVC